MPEGEGLRISPIATAEDALAAGGKEGCAGCFSRQVAKRREALESGEEPKPLCKVAARMQEMLDASMDEAKGAANPPVSLAEDELQAVSPKAGDRRFDDGFVMRGGFGS